MWFTSKPRKKWYKILYVIVEIISWNIKVVLLQFFLLNWCKKGHLLEILLDIQNKPKSKVNPLAYIRGEMDLNITIKGPFTNFVSILYLDKFMRHFITILWVNWVEKRDKYLTYPKYPSTDIDRKSRESLISLPLIVLFPLTCHFRPIFLLLSIFSLSSSLSFTSFQLPFSFLLHSLRHFSLRFSIEVKTASQGGLVVAVNSSNFLSLYKFVWFMGLLR